MQENLIPAQNYQTPNNVIIMKITKFLAIPIAIATFAVGSLGIAGAQVVASPKVALQFATNGLTNPLVASSTGSTIARLLLDTTGSTEAVRISSLPFNLVLGGTATVSPLMNCQVYNEAAPTVALNTPASATTTLNSGINNIALNNSLVIAANTLTTLALRCDVSGSLTAGNTFTVNMNTGNVVAVGALTGLPALVTIRGSAVVPPVVVPPVVTPGVPATGASEATNAIAMITASLFIASLGFSYLTLKKS